MATEYPVHPVSGFHERAHRMNEAMRQAWEDYGLDCLQKWMAFRFADGDTDARLYETKSEAMRYQPREQDCCYVLMSPEMGLKDCHAYLYVHETLYDGGLRVIDPDEPVHLDFETQRSEEWQNHGLTIPTSFPRNLRKR